MRWWLAVLAALGLTALAAQADAESVRKDRALVVTRPDWDRLPSGEDLARYYPERAQRLELEGGATILCGVETAGALRDCEVVSEEPADGEFGAAALKLAPLFRMKPATRDGAPVGGAKIRIPMVSNWPSRPPRRRTPRRWARRSPTTWRSCGAAVRRARISKPCASGRRNCICRN